MFFLLASTAARVTAALGGNSSETSSERDRMNGIDEALAKAHEELLRKLTTDLDRAETEQ